MLRTFGGNLRSNDEMSEEKLIGIDINFGIGIGIGIVSVLIEAA